MQQRFTALGIELAGLLDEEVVHVGVAAVRVQTILDEVVLKPGGRIALAARARVHDRRDLLVLPVAEERRALHRPELRADARRAELVANRLRDAPVRGVDRELARVEPVRIAGLGQERSEERRVGKECRTRDETY